MRGLSIVLVVMFHVQLVDMATGANHSLCTTLPTIFTPIRMPFFIFTSGGLLYLSRIRCEWTTRALYADKLRRIAIPFVFFVTFYYLFKLLAGAWAKTPVPLSLSYYAECFYRFTGHPSAHLWFLATLLMLMALYPLFVAVCRNHTASVTMLLFSVGIYHADLESVLPDVFYINHLHRYLVYFYFGIFFFRYRLYRFTDNPLVAVAAVAVYAAAYCVVGGLATSIAGIVMCVAVGAECGAPSAGPIRHFPRLYLPDLSHVDVFPGLCRAGAVEASLLRRAPFPGLLCPQYPCRHLSAHPRGAVGTATALPPRAPVLGHQGVSAVRSATYTVPPTTHIMEMRQNSPYELFWRISCLPA